MSFERAKAELSGTRFVDLRWVAETGSTNADVRDAVGSGGPVVLVADHQSAGRGRLDRTWDAPPGTSLLLSIGLPVDAIDPQRRALLTFALALAATDAVPELTIKWPNDLIVLGDDDPLGYRKVGGILAESHTVRGGGDWVVLGIGINANWPSIPDELADTATSLNHVLGGDVDREQLLVDLLGAFDRRWLPLVEAGGDDLLAAFRQRCSTLGQRVRIELPGSVLVGAATDVSSDGALLVTGQDGAQVHVVTAGDVVHLRPDPA